jgi:Icc protein
LNLNNNFAERMMTTYSRRQLVTAGSALLLSELIPWSGQLAFGSLNSFGRSVRFGVLADAHVDISGTNGWRMGAISVRALQNTVKDMNAAALDFVLVPGDLLLDGEWENLRVAKGLLDRLSCPYFIISGNHDYRPADPGRIRREFSYMTTEDFVNVFQGHGYGPEKTLHWSEAVVPGLRVIALDGCLREARGSWGGILPHSQILRLESSLRLSSEPVIIMVHHCLLHWGDDGKSVEGRWHSLENSQEVRRLLEKYREKIVMVISGHRHIGLHHQTIGGVEYFVVPSINSHPMRYSLFELDSAGLKWTTPRVGVEESLHEIARDGLLRTWWFAKLNERVKQELLGFYENEPDRTGILLFESLQELYPDSLPVYRG